MPEQPTTGELLKAGTVTDDQLNTAIVAYLKGP